MSIRSIHEVAFGAELEPFVPDTSLVATSAAADAVGWGGGRFTNHDQARREGFPAALVPGVMAMGFLTSMIHRWSPAAQVRRIDTVFRAPLLADQPAVLSAVVTDIDVDAGLVQLDLTVKNDAGETRVFGTADVLLPTTTG